MTSLTYGMTIDASFMKLLLIWIEKKDKNIKDADPQAMKLKKKTKQIPKRADFFNKFNSLNSDWNIFTDGSKI